MDGLSFSQSPLTDPAFKDTPIFANPRFRSPFYAYDKSRPLYFLQSTNGTKTIFATLDLSQLPDLPLILLQNSSSGELSAKVYADDLKSFPGGSYRLINFTDQALTVKFNDLSLDIAPKSDQVCVPEAKTGNVQLQLLKTGSKSIIYSNLFTYNVSVRWIFFLVENDAKEISFLRLSDSVSTAQAPTPTPTPSPTHIPKKHHKPKPN